jgi:hypothetical protein
MSPENFGLRYLGFTTERNGKGKTGGGSLSGRVRRRTLAWLCDTESSEPGQETRIKGSKTHEYIRLAKSLRGARLLPCLPACPCELGRVCACLLGALACLLALARIG